MLWTTFMSININLHDIFESLWHYTILYLTTSYMDIDLVTCAEYHDPEIWQSNTVFHKLMGSSLYSWIRWGIWWEQSRDGLSLLLNVWDFSWEDFRVGFGGWGGLQRGIRLHVWCLGWEDLMTVLLTAVPFHEAWLSHSTE